MAKHLFKKGNTINKGKIPWNKGKKGLQKAWNKGKKCPWVTEKNLIMNSGRTGDKAFNWKGGKTSRERKILMARKKYQSWRLSVLERDSFMCQSCYVKGEILHAHHIKSWLEYEELRYDIDNGVSLCRKCHENIHRKNK